MAKRTDSQRIGAEGQRLVAYLAEAAGGWIARSQDEDYGVDMELELDTPEVAGQILKVQIKTTSQIAITDRGVPIKVERSLAAYADLCRAPVLLVQADLEREEAWYLWVQHWLMNKRQGGLGIHSLPESSTEYVSVTQTLTNGLRGDLHDVARWSTETQLVLTLNDAVRTAAAVYRLEILHVLLDLLGKLDSISESFPVDLIVDQAITLGTRLWATPEGNQAANALFAVCRKLGSRFTADQVQRMVLRDDGYSRTGVNALGFLYDVYPDHLATLGLVTFFESQPAVAYYCKLRQAYPGRKTMDMLRTPDLFALGGWQLDPQSLDRIFDKWANRGDSAILDYLIPFGDPAAS